jgi:hypothetical protein
MSDRRIRPPIGIPPSSVSPRPADAVAGGTLQPGGFLVRLFLRHCIVPVTAPFLRSLC